MAEPIRLKKDDGIVEVLLNRPVREFGVNGEFGVKFLSLTLLSVCFARC
jgi:hypothetical protein